MSTNQSTRKVRSRIDDEIVIILRAEMKARGISQKDLAAAAGMTQPQVSVRFNGGASIPVEQVLRMCAALGLNPSDVMRTAEEKATAWRKPVTTRHPSALPETEQIAGLGRRLAASLWDGCHDEDFIPIAINQIMTRENRDFWTGARKQLVLMHALADLAAVVGGRHPQRDQFLLEQEVDHADITP